MVELLGDFGFASEADRAHAIALGLLPLVRGWIEGSTPLHLIEAPLRGTGKTLLWRSLMAITIGIPLEQIPGVVAVNGGAVSPPVTLVVLETRCMNIGGD
jgi:hypothetical protein